MIRTAAYALCVASLSLNAQAATMAFADHPNTNSQDWTNYVVSHGGSVALTLDFESHPLGALQEAFYASQGVHMTLAASSLSYNAVQDYRNNYNGTVYGYGPNSSGEGLASENRNFAAYNPNGAWTLTLSFDQAVMGTGLYVIDLFNGLGNRRTTLAAYDGVDGSGNLLALATAPDYNFQLYNKVFLGVAADSASIRSVVFTNPYPYYGDGIALDDIRIAAVPEPRTGTLMMVGLGMAGWVARRRLHGRT